MSGLSPTFLLLCLAAAVLLAVALTLWVSSLLRGLRLRWRLMRSKSAERQTPKLLAEHGYRAVAQQVGQSYSYWVNGEERRATVRADWLAKRRGRLYVVEVKTGRATTPGAGPTRRQLLEYRHAFGVDGLLLANMEAHLLYLVEFGRR